MIYVGIDVAKDKHDCFITNSEGEVLEKPFTIQNNQEGFDSLFGKISGHAPDGKVKVGLEATATTATTSWLSPRQRSSHLCPESAAHESFSEKVKALERPKRIKSIPVPLHIC
jgi:hypothetical protein